MFAKLLDFLFRLLQFSIDVIYFFNKKDKYLTQLFIREFSNGFSDTVKNL